MMKTNSNRYRGTGIALTGMLLLAIAQHTGAQPPKEAPSKMAAATPPLTIARANLAKNASFLVTQTLAPKGGVEDRPLLHRRGEGG